MATAADVPGRYDLVIGDEGYVLAENWTGGDTSNAPQKAIHSFSPAFVQRTNIQGNYGDDQQEFWLTFSQKDWSLGENQRYARTGEEIGPRRYWRGTKINVTTPGQVSMRREVSSVNISSDNVVTIAPRSTAVRLASATNLYTIDPEGTITDHGAHGLGDTPASPHGLACDASDTYITVAAQGVRKWDGSAFSTFSASGANSIAYLNNSLYGFALGVLYRWSTAGTRSPVFSWLDSDGGAQNYGATDGQLLPFGGKLLINLTVAAIAGSTWIYDGVGVSKLFNHPPNFVSRSICELNGTVFLGGFFSRNIGASTEFRPGVMYYANGSVGLLWQADAYVTLASDISGSCVTALENGILFTDDSTEKFMWYDIGAGGVHSVGAYATTGTGIKHKLVSCNNFALLSEADNIVYMFPDDTTVATTSTVTSSLIDFDSSLNKIFRGIKVEYDEASDGDGGSVDISYRVGDVDGSYTSLQAGITSGDEYTLSSITGRAISYRITLNKGTSTLGPILKRVYIRAVPLGNNYHRARYVLAAWGKGGESPVKRRDDTLEPRTGLQVAMDLMDAAESQVPLSITDKFETFTGIVENCELVEFRDREFVAQVTVRQI